MRRQRGWCWRGFVNDWSPPMDVSGYWLHNSRGLATPCEAAGCKRHIGPDAWYFRLDADGWGPWCSDCALCLFGALPPSPIQPPDTDPA